MRGVSSSETSQRGRSGKRTAGSWARSSSRSLFQNFTTDSFRSILSEARKYRLCLTLGHQYISQLPEPLQAAIFGNVGSMIAFRVGYEDAEILATHFHPSGPQAMAPHAFSDLAQYEAWARVMREGEISDPIHVKTLPPLAPTYRGRDRLIQNSRDRFATRRAVMEQKITKWMSERKNPY
jgi:hypothetical protein